MCKGSFWFFYGVIWVWYNKGLINYIIFVEVKLVCFF